MRPQLAEVVEVVDGMLPALGPGRTVVDCSTIDPEVERAQHAAGDRHRRRVPRRPAVGRHGGGAEGNAHPDGGRRRLVLAETEPAFEPLPA